MTANHDRDSVTDVPIDEIDPLEDIDAEDPVGTAASIAADGAKTGLLPLAGGGVLLISALRSFARGKFRSLPLGFAGYALVRYGLRKRRSSEDDAPTFEPATDDVDGGTEGKETSDEAATATGRPEGVDIDEQGEVPEEAEPDADDGGSRIEFTEDEPGDRNLPQDEPELEDADAADPRRGDDLETDDGGTEIDLSSSSMAEEASEAAGPSPEQSQPSQTDSTEPEASPDEDASDMKVEPDEDADDAKNEDGTEAENGDADEAETAAESEDENGDDET